MEKKVPTPERKINNMKLSHSCIHTIPKSGEIYSQTCIKRLHLEQRKLSFKIDDLIKEVILI